MSHHSSHHLKRLQHDVNSNLHLSSHNHQSHHSRPNSSDHRSRLPTDEAIRESIQHFTISNNNTNDPQLSRSFNPAPQRARRGGGRSRNRHWHSSLTLPKRAINYDLAESFMDHSTNPLSSDLYKIKFKHSTKQWPYGRFKTYKEKLDKLDGNITDIICIRTFPIVAKRKKNPETNQTEQIDQPTTTIPTTSLLTLVDPIVQEEKKKQVDKQTNIYAHLFGGGRIPRLSSTTQTRKANSTTNPTSSSSTSISLLDEDLTDHQP